MTGGQLAREQKELIKLLPLNVGLRPFLYRSLVSPKRLFFVIAMSWAIGFASAVPSSFGVGGWFLDPGPRAIPSCVLTVTDDLGQGFVAIGTFVPYALQLGCYLAVYWTVLFRHVKRRRQVALAAPNRVAELGRERRRLDAVRTLLCSFL
ncbi:hypothetical protein BV898_05613 [Hypsibius exemplaris]|uniref:G-protein coupled receptors family 1 profile domain-containing protein n=1 Tax=Hypsibius exemplaris TaxID=2072580 RepID=A0A1W0WYR0_HYPEX|nr:hypothetical protein BV898_05613 [Hypsibius exemplaris]